MFSTIAAIVLFAMIFTIANLLALDQGESEKPPPPAGSWDVHGSNR